MNSITFCSKLYFFNRYQWAKLGKNEKNKDKFEWKFNNRMKITNKYIIILHTSTADLFLKIEKKKYLDTITGRWLILQVMNIFL